MSNNGLPYGELAIIAMKSCKEIAGPIDSKLSAKREKASHLIDVDEVRFSNGEGKVVIKESIRGKDVYILCDVGNYGCTYNMFGFENHMSPDDHLQDIKRVLSAIAGKARRITLILPLLYASRQHRRKGRESLDCALALQEFERLGVKDIITFDAHDPTIQNAVPLISFENLHPSYKIIKALLTTEKHMIVDAENFIVISPDTGAMDRALYYSSNLGVDTGLFYKRRDHSKIVNGKNPIVQHDYLGRDVKGCNVLIVDDMIASGQSVFDICEELKKRGAKKIFVAVTFALFTSGSDKFDKYYEEGLLDGVYATNLSYVPENIKSKVWFKEVNMAGFAANVIETLNMDNSIAPLLDSTKLIRKLVKKVNKGETIED
ncbi:ribose-phosphate pyrophosphokinase [Fusibacter sp. JL216-2]|uniref:ribose-phosphate pyrophosphokinase n=1 Tax=Fusibacter sp. JL216-2 TaxID=3071453 RepID=UPI003D345CBD